MIFLANAILTELSLENLKNAYFGFYTYFFGIIHERAGPVANSNQ